MKRIRSIWNGWQQDRTLRSVVRNTGYLFTSNSITMVLSPIQGFLAAFLLGPAGYGTLMMVVLLASTVNRLLSFRMNELVIKNAGQDLALGNRQRAAAIIKVAGITEAGTSVFAYLLLVLIAPLASQYIIKDPSASRYVMLYGIALLANFVTESGTAVLQIGNHFRSQAALNVLQYVISTTMMVIAYFTNGSFLFVLSAYLVGRLVYGLGIMIFAVRWLKPMLGEGWYKAPLSLITDKRDLIKFAVSTNLSGTLNMIIRDSEVLWVGYFLTKTEAGYYSFARNIVVGMMTPITPLVNTIFPEMSKFVARKEWNSLKSILRKTTWLAAAYSAACMMGVLAFGSWFLGILKGGLYLPSLPAILVLMIGYAAANTVFWNRAILLSFNKPNEPLFITAVVGLIKTALLFVVVRPFGYVAQAALLTGYFVITAVWITWRALVELKHNLPVVEKGFSE